MQQGELCHHSILSNPCRGGYMGGAMGAFAPPPGQGCCAESRKVPQVGHILRRKCPRWGAFYRESAPGGADFTEKVPQVGHISRWGQILQRKCPRWGTYPLTPSPLAAFAARLVARVEGAPQHACRTCYLPQLFFGPAPWKSLHPPLPCNFTRKMLTGWSSVVWPLSPCNMSRWGNILVKTLWVKHRWCLPRIRLLEECVDITHSSNNSLSFFHLLITSALPMGFLPDSHPNKLMINYSMIKLSRHRW